MKNYPSMNNNMNNLKQIFLPVVLKFLLDWEKETKEKGFIPTVDLLIEELGNEIQSWN